MKITTLANFGETIYYMEENSVHSAEVKTINLSVNRSGDFREPDAPPVVKIVYFTIHGKYDEKDVFLSKGELLGSL